MKWVPATAGFDEIFDKSGAPRDHYASAVSVFDSLEERELARRRRLQELSLRNLGITFGVQGEKSGIERVWPFDFVPRILPADEWARLEAGLIQRVTAINIFLTDIYTEQHCLREGIVPWELILTRPEYQRAVRNVVPPQKIFTHVVGTDLIRDADGTFRVLEDNSRCPSGVSYVIENRALLNRSIPELFSAYPVRPVSDYPHQLLDTLLFVAPRWSERAQVVVLSPGIHNSAYFEHSFLAREMGVPLVQPSDLIVEDNYVYLRATEGRQRVDVIYRRIDDAFLDPLAFRPDSLLGVAGLINSYRSGNVALANAPGAGVADDKATYAFIPDLIRFYLSEEPLLEQVKTYVGLRPDDFRYMIDHLDELVVKTTGDSGGYGMLMGPSSSSREIKRYREEMESNPGNYIAQPLIELSSHATYSKGNFVPRRIDLRPFVLYGDRIRVLPGGLTRVALREGSYVVNSSQGGGSKDTWVLEGNAR